MMISGNVKRAIVRLAYILTVAIAIFAVCEIFARMIYRESYLSGLFRDDRIFHHLPPPYYKGGMQSPDDFDLSFTTNNRGMRGPGDYTYKKGEGVFRIAVLGDSFTFGVGVAADQTASSVLEKMLNRDGSGAARKYQVYNFGVNSFSPVLEYIYLKREAIKYSPDLVILMLDLCDLQDDYLYEPHIVKDASGDVLGCDPFKRSGAWDPKAFAMRYSRLYFILDQKLFQSFRKMRTIGFGRYIYNKLHKVRNKTEILTNKDIDNIEFDRFLFVRDGKDKDIVARHWSRTAGYLRMIKEYLDARGVPFILVAYPYGHQVSQRQWSKGRVYWAFDPNRVYDGGEAFATIEDFARSSGIAVVNVYDAFKTKKDQPLYFTSDGHCTALGQTLIAEKIYDSPAFRRATGR
jgi:hypothetical protein